MKKADEMEMTINFKAIRLSWVFIIVFLMVWILLDIAINGHIPSVQLILLLLQNAIFFGYKAYLTHSMIH